MSVNRPILSVVREEVTGGVRVRLYSGTHPATRFDTLVALRDDPAFRAWFNDLLAAVPFTAFRWETPGTTLADALGSFEFVALDAPFLARNPDPEAFAEHFRPDAPVVAFPNLGGDATLIVPCPRAAHTAYGHLAAFAREAPEAQRDAFWKLVAVATINALGTTPMWLSTAGAGVSWLHVRLDRRPKYYGHEPYRRGE
ncbi:MAG: hypothetical protein K2V38_08895 [Gemmataceae bacterium]|nr:hypothetical protein [Gemmataceae bacterium]